MKLPVLSLCFGRGQGMRDPGRDRWGRVINDPMNSRIGILFFFSSKSTSFLHQPPSFCNLLLRIYSNFLIHFRIGSLYLPIHQSSIIFSVPSQKWIVRSMLRGEDSLRCDGIGGIISSSLLLSKRICLIVCSSSESSRGGFLWKKKDSSSAR